MTPAAQVKHTRHQLGLKQRELAALLGVHAITVSRWESGALSPPPYQLALLRHFGQVELPKGADVGVLLVTSGAIGTLERLFAWAARPAEDAGPVARNRGG